MTQVINFKMQDLEIANLTQRCIGVLGTRGTGKTTLLKLFVNALPKDLPAIIIDPLNVIFIKNIQKINIHRKDIGKGKEAGKLFQEMLQKRKKVIISFIDLLGIEMVQFMDDMVPEIHQKGFMWIIDEAHELLPEISQVGGHFSVEMGRMVKHGRNRNSGIFFTTQRPAFCSKTLLGLADMFIIFRLSYPNDLKVVNALTQNKELTQRLAGAPFLHGILLDFDKNSGKYLTEKSATVLK